MDTSRGLGLSTALFAGCVGFAFGDRFGFAWVVVEPVFDLPAGWGGDPEFGSHQCFDGLGAFFAVGELLVYERVVYESVGHVGGAVAHGEDVEADGSRVGAPGFADLGVAVELVVQLGPGHAPKVCSSTRRPRCWAERIVAWVPCDPSICTAIT